jgi:hypothetical protein
MSKVLQENKKTQPSTQFETKFNEDNEIVERSLEKTEKKVKISEEDLKDLLNKNLRGSFSKNFSKTPEFNSTCKRREEKTQKLKKKVKKVEYIELVNPLTSKLEKFKLLSEKRVFRGFVKDDLDDRMKNDQYDDDCPTDSKIKNKAKCYMILKILETLMNIKTKTKSL